jgi:imidazolonepropionase-like amidohydrolase
MSTRTIALVVLFVSFPLATSPLAQTSLADRRAPAVPKATLAIVGGTLIDGHEGPPLPNAVVLVDGNTISAVGRQDALSVPPGVQTVDARGMVVMPGLIDVHVHMDLLGHTDYDYWHKAYSSRYAETMAISARQMLMSGVTTAVDLNGQPEALIATRKRIDSGEIPGPRLKASMGWITNVPDSEWERNHRRAFTWNVHTGDDARAAVSKVIGYGADIVKVIGGLTKEQVRAIADAAHEKHLRVTGHVGDRQDLLARIEAGQDAIEHLDLGAVRSEPNIDPEIVKALVAHQTYVVPAMTTRMAQVNAIEWPGLIDNHRARALTPPEIWDDIQRSAMHPDRLPYFGGAAYGKGQKWLEGRFKQLREAGVRLLVGTDAGTPLNYPSDSLWHEMDLMVRFGVPPMEVIGMATRRNAEYMRLGNDLGTIVPGKLADIIVVDGNPLLSMRDLRHVAVVVKDGKVVKRAAEPVRSSDSARP